MAMNHGWGRAAAGPPRSFEQRLGTRDCDIRIGELVLRGGVARLFARSCIAYDATLELHNGQRVVVEVFSTGAAHGRETRFGDGWRDICEDFNLMPGDAAVFSKAAPAPAPAQERERERTFLASFYDADGNQRLSRFGALDPPSSPEFQFNVDWLRAQGAEACRGEHVAGAGGGEGALQGGDMTIKEAMDLAVKCGAVEGSDEHYMATKLFVMAENRAMFLTFRTNAGRLQWLRRCFEDRMN